MIVLNRDNHQSKNGYRKIENMTYGKLKQKNDYMGISKTEILGL